ncbi:MAG: hypothetical protein IT536_05140 [Hyphomicrobiales bacterium]|nr:hypothetical protein [Hyphomicrobiales bacterium]
MISTYCRRCGEPVKAWAAACGACGMVSPNQRSLLFAVVGLGGAVLAALLAVLLLSPPRSSDWSTAAVDGDYKWLEAAMQQCDQQAAKDVKGLHYLVIPLVDEPRDDPGWRRISINDIGNAILINSEDMLAGLRRKALRITADEYTFSMRNERTRDILTWKPATGARKFVVSDASDITEFRVQFQSNDAARAINWGALFQRQEGNCYWVNAILRH